MEYRVIRSRRRSVSLEVTAQAELVVRVPCGMGEQAIAAFVERHLDWAADAIARQAARRENHPEPSREEIARLCQRAKSELPEKVARYAAVMGVAPTAIHITSARTRFGSCSGKNSLSFSWRLMQYPEEAVDYVVVHELAHICHHDHSRAFYDVVASVLPDYKSRAKLLKI